MAFFSASYCNVMDSFLISKGKKSFSSYFLVYNIISISCDVFGTHSIALDFIEIKVCKERHFIILFSHTFEPPLSRLSLNMTI